MVIGTCTIELHLPGNGSLKGSCPLKPFKRGQPALEPTTGARLVAVGVLESEMEVRNNEHSRDFGIAR